MRPKKEQLQVPGHPDYLPDLREFVSTIGTAYQLPEKLVNTFKLAVDEAATNIIKHAYRNYQNAITIQADVQKARVTFILIDQGNYFDPCWADDPNPTESAKRGERPPLGIFMLRKLMDKIEYVRTDRGNELRLIKMRKPRRKRSSSLKYIALSLTVYTVIIAAIFAYFRSGVTEKLSNQYYISGKVLTNTIAEKINSIRTEVLQTTDGQLYTRAMLQPIYENNIWQIYNISIIDTAGKIQWSTRSSQIGMLFSRPSSTHISEGVFAYSIEGVDVLEFEQQVNSDNQGLFAGKVQVLLMQEYLKNKIALQKLDYLKNCSIALAAGYFLIAVFVFLSQSNLISVRDSSKKFLNKFKFDPTIQPINIIKSDNLIKDIDGDKVDKLQPSSNNKQSQTKTTKLPKERSIKNSQEGTIQTLQPPEGVVSSKSKQSKSLNDTVTSSPLLPAIDDKEKRQEPVRKQEESMQEKLTSSLPGNLMYFLDLLNKDRDTIKQILDCFHPQQAILNDLSQKNQTKANMRAEVTAEEPNAPETSAVKNESFPEKESDLGFEFNDISDSLVDNLFEDYVNKISPDQQLDNKEIVKSDLSADTIQKSEKPDPRSRKRKKATNKKENSNLPEIKVPAGADKPETDREARLLLVESLTDVLAQAKTTQSRKKLEAPSEQSPETDEKQVKSIAQENKPEKTTQSVIETTLANGITSFRKKLYEDAIIAFRKVLKLDSENKNALVMLGNSYYKNNMTKEALSAYETLKKNHPNESIAHENLALIYAEQDLYQLAIREWKSALKLNPHRRDLMEKINLASEALKGSTMNAKLSQDTGRNPTQSDKNREITERERIHLLNKGIARYRQRDFESAIQIFESIIQKSPDFQEAYSFLGIIYFRNKMFEKSKIVFEKLQQIKTETASIHENLGFIYAQEGSYREALSELKKVLKLTPKRTDIKEKVNKFAQLV